MITLEGSEGSEGDRASREPLRPVKSSLLYVKGIANTRKPAKDYVNEERCSVRA